jgi:hypothetical protein
MVRVSRRAGLWIAGMVAITAMLACSLGSGTSASAPTQAMNEPSPAPSAQPASDGDRITVSGDLDYAFGPASTSLSDLVGTTGLSLLDTDGISGVTLFFPTGTQPGQYAIGDLFNLANADITARFDRFAGVNSSYWESLKGTLVLTQVSPGFSGSFTFEAVDTPDGLQHVTVQGSFTGVTP